MEINRKKREKKRRITFRKKKKKKREIEVRHNGREDERLNVD